MSRYNLITPHFTALGASVLGLICHISLRHLQNSSVILMHVQVGRMREEITSMRQTWILRIGLVINTTIFHHR
jgi:uncharacterized protein YigA (DUF484 family)